MYRRKIADNLIKITVNMRIYSSVKGKILMADSIYLEKSFYQATVSADLF